MDRTARRTRIAVAAAAAAVVAMALPLAVAGAAHAQTAPPPVTPPADDASSIAALVADAAQQASAQAAAQQAGPRLRAQGGEPGPDGSVYRGLDQALDALVADGAVAVTARVETPAGSWAGAAGTRERDGRSPARTQDRFRVGSITKPMIATLVMQEVEKGTWSLDTAVADVLPGVLPPGVTIEQLLSHRSGAPTGTDWLVALRMTDPNSVDEYFEVVGQEFTEADHVVVLRTAPWVLEPGTGYSYSNAGYVVLGLMLERVTGEDVDDLLEDRVFAPARMRHSDLAERPGTRGPFLEEYAFTGSEGAGWYSLEHFHPSLFRSAGAVTSTTGDLADFTTALVTGSLVSEETTAGMLAPRTVDDYPNPDYGLGVYRVPDPCVPGEFLYGHDGATYGTLAVALTSADGARTITLGVTGRDVAFPFWSDEPLYDLNTVLVPMLVATC
ncbi:serine hydrolase domain-containing protein [Antribacter gilvus]|uniref:serine hydrolase domain-containing protein n=1 Tax=Antribacter gilvus TaxID=2304675 RepID=UPI000F7748DD|nr:serine hydrolase domain-containing protein [Antribacter gilvus]